MKTSRLVCFKHAYWCVIIPSLNLHCLCSGPVNRSEQTARNWCLNSTWPALLLGFLPSSEFPGAEKCWYIHLWNSRIWNHVWPLVLNWHCWIKTNKNLRTQHSLEWKSTCKVVFNLSFLPPPCFPVTCPGICPLGRCFLIFRCCWGSLEYKDIMKVLFCFLFGWFFCCYCCCFSKSLLKTPGNWQKVLDSFLVYASLSYRFSHANSFF